jgi:DNA-binding transcriptional ArsR family regulator
MTKPIKLSDMQASADKACNLMKVLSNRDRLMLVCQISLGEKCVKELEDILQIHQPTLSQQLTVLRNEGLVKTRKEGKNIYYSLASEVAISVIGLLHDYYCKK